MNASICAQCNVCEGLIPVQFEERKLSLDFDDTKQPILIIDDSYGRGEMEASLVALEILDLSRFDYTSTVRCACFPEMFSEKELETVFSRCSVWTSLVAEDRKLILSTKKGLQQLKVGEGREEGDAFRVGRLGVVLCIKPLLEMTTTERRIYKEKAKRVLREAGLLK